jgi:hypothetical protein
MSAFAKGFGRWLGSGEVYDGAGRFVGNGMDVRHVQKLDDAHTRIDVTFIGAFKASGHYIIEARDGVRLYRGPINVGYAEAISASLVDANAYWADLGLTQRFFLYVLPDGKTQLSLAQLSRGDQLIYTVVGENRLVDDTPDAQPTITHGTAYDLHDDPTAGRGVSLWARAGTWEGELHTLAGAGVSCVPHREAMAQAGEGLRWSFASPTLGTEATLTLKHNGWQAWTPRGLMVGSLNLCGGRAASGYFYHDGVNLRVWRREVLAHDGTQKAVVQLWYRGGERVAVEYGVLYFTPKGETS